MQPGLKRINWYSLNIVDYAASCDELLKGFSTLVTQIHRIFRHIEKRILKELSCFNLITGEHYDETNQIIECKRYFMSVESRRQEILTKMLESYRSITPILLKVESLVHKTATGKNPFMELYYEYFEYQIFTALVE